MSKKFATLDSVKGSDGAAAGRGEDGDSSGDEEKGQAFYVGGGERSGQEVLGPPREREGRGANAMAEALMRAVGEQPADAPLDGEEGEAVPVALHLWSNGFSVEDGPLRDYMTPDGQAFMRTVMRGQVPPELIQTYGRNVDLGLDKKTGEEYKPPPMKAFSGQGNRLGSFLPGMATQPGEATSSSQPPAPAPQSPAKPAGPIEVKGKLVEGEPTTTLQLRMPDNSRLRIILNPSHSLSHARDAVIDARPDLALQLFSFHGGFPIKKLEDEKATLKEAGLLNSLIHVKVTKIG